MRKISDTVKEIIFNMCLSTPCSSEAKQRIIQCWEKDIFTAEETEEIIKLLDLEDA